MTPEDNDRPDNTDDKAPEHDMPSGPRSQFLNWRLAGWIVLLVVAVGLLISSLPS